MAATLWRLYSKSICNSLQGIILNKPFIQKQLLLSSRTRSLSFSSDSQFGSATAEVCSNTGLKTGGGIIVKEGFLRWENGGGTCHSSAQIYSSALVEFGAVVHEKAVLGAEVHVGSGTVIGPSVDIGPSTRIGYNVSISNCSIGDSCVIHNGVCIGQDGFGFYVDEHGNMVKKPQIGHNVIIGKCCLLCGQVGIAGSVT
ncbi:putative protein [Arabidopsis thaliana]|nr:putative protein [Arabidopsis thaliana]CAB79122.1 putative protein [Arabidopsis thaliana]